MGDSGNIFSDMRHIICLKFIVQLHSLTGLYALSMDDLPAAREHFLIALKTNPPNKFFNILSLLIIGIRQQRADQIAVAIDDIDNIPLKAAFHISSGLNALARSDIDEAK